MREEELIILAVYGAILGGILLVSLIVQAVICWITAGMVRDIPEECRETSPGKVWLLMIPCWALIWNFFVFMGLARSFKRFFDEIDDGSVGDCGEQLGLLLDLDLRVDPAVYPVRGGAGGAILLIITLVKAHELRKRVVAEIEAGNYPPPDAPI